jgi:hypothetical protein
LSWDGFDPDLFGNFGADPEASLANLANDIRVPTQETDTLFLAKAQFAEANGEFG